METSREQAMSALETLVANGSMALTDNDLKIFPRDPEEIEQYNNRLSEIYQAMFNGFFHCAAEGSVLVPENRIAENFGHSIKDNYPEANEVFLKFAKTYWTLRVLTYDLLKNDMGWIGAHLLGKLEQDIGPVFFPFPGPAKIAPSKREETQRELIKESRAKIDLEEFIRGNPILIRDRAIKKDKIEISKDLYKFCRNCVYKLAVSINKTLLRGIEYEACFEMVMDMLLVPSEERTAIFEDITIATISNNIPYHKLSPLNQFIVTIPGYVFYCLKTELHHSKDLFNEAVILMQHPSFPRYLQVTIGVPISKEIKGALWTPSIRDFLMTLILSALVFAISYFLFGWSWWLSLLVVGGVLVLDRARKKHIGRL